MKKLILTLIPCLCAALVLGGCGKNPEKGEPTADNKPTGEGGKDKQIADLRKKLAQAEKDASEKARVEFIAAPVATPTSTTDATALIERLADKEITGEDAETQRKVIHMFESLVEGGNNSVAAIDQFLGDNVDKEFGRKTTRQELGITTAQMEEMRAAMTKAMEENRAKMGEIMRNQDMSREERGQAMRALWEGARDDMTSFLTEEQRAKIENMEGGAGDLIRGMLRGGGDRGRSWGGDRGSSWGGERGRGPGGGGRGPGGGR